MLRNTVFLSLVCLLISKIPTANVKDMRHTKEPESRRQNRPQMTPPRPPGYKKKTGRDDGYYEPYWEKGDWVFYRKSSTNKPQGFFLNNGSSTQHAECNQICLQNYQDYGVICAMRYNRHTYKHEFQTFDNMCYLELANCVSGTKRYDWYPIKKGNCTEGITLHPTDPTGIASRKVVWEQKFP